MLQWATKATSSFQKASESQTLKALNRLHEPVLNHSPGDGLRFGEGDTNREIKGYGYEVNCQVVVKGQSIGYE